MPPKKDQGQGHYYGFDSSGLEKAAVAAKYLDQSKNAKEAFDIAKKKEETKQLELKENTVKIETQKIQIAEEERRKTKQYEVEMGKRQAEYQVQLELQRDQQKMQQKEAMREQRRQADEESLARQEQMKRGTLEYEQQIKASVKQQMIEQEMNVQRELAGENRTFLQGLFDKYEKDRRETTKQNLITGFNMVTSSLSNAMMNPKFLLKATQISLIVFGSYHMTRLFLGMSAQLVMARFGKPTLVRETSKVHSSSFITLPFMYGQRFYQRMLRRTEKDLLDGVILEKNLENQLRDISYAILNRKKHFAPCKNMMFYGPPGTGKTLFAKKLAMQSGLEYAVMVGSDIAPLGNVAVQELNKLFDWAEQQPNGIVLFIDEADAFLRNRKNQEMSEQMRHSINSFLYRTGTPSDRVILVMATNTPDQLDEAVHDRIDEVVGFGLPSAKERKIMLLHYLVKYCKPPTTTQEKAMFLWRHPKSIYTGKKLIRMEGVDQDVIEDIANKTEGFSGREITKMVIAWHDAAFSTEEALLTPDIMHRILTKFQTQHKLKSNWSKEEALILEKLITSSREEEAEAATKRAMGESQ